MPPSGCLTSPSPPRLLFSNLPVVLPRSLQRSHSPPILTGYFHLFRFAFLLRFPILLHCCSYVLSPLRSNLNLTTSHLLVVMLKEFSVLGLYPRFHFRLHFSVPHFFLPLSLFDVLHIVYLASASMLEFPVCLSYCRRTCSPCTQESRLLALSLHADILLSSICFSPSSYGARASYASTFSLYG